MKECGPDIVGNVRTPMVDDVLQGKTKAETLVLPEQQSISKAWEIGRASDRKDDLGKSTTHKPLEKTMNVRR